MRSEEECARRLASLDKYLDEQQVKMLESNKNHKHLMEIALLREALLEGYASSLRWVLGIEDDDDLVDMIKLKKKLGEAHMQWPEDLPPRKMFN